MVGLVIGSLVLLVSRLNSAALLNAMISADRRYLVAAVVLNLVYFGVRGVRWWVILHGMGCRLALSPAVGISCLGVFTSSIYPGLGEATRVMLLRRQAVLLATAASAVVLERIADTLIFALVFLDDLAWHWHPPSSGVRLGAWAEVMAVSVVGGTVIIRSVLLSRSGRRIVAGLLFTARMERIAQRARSFVDEVREALSGLAHDPWRCLHVAALTVAVQLLSVGTAWLVCLAFDVDPPFIVVVTLIVAINLGLGLVPSPLGIGLYQLAGLAILGGYAGGPATAIAIATALQGVNYAATTVAAIGSMVSVMRPRSPTIGHAVSGIRGSR